MQTLELLVLNLIFFFIFWSKIFRTALVTNYLYAFIIQVPLMAAGLTWPGLVDASPNLS